MAFSVAEGFVMAPKFLADREAERSFRLMGVLMGASGNAIIWAVGFPEAVSSPPLKPQGHPEFFNILHLNYFLKGKYI